MLSMQQHGSPLRLLFSDHALHVYNRIHQFLAFIGTARVKLELIRFPRSRLQPSLLHRVMLLKMRLLHAIRTIQTHLLHRILANMSVQVDTELAQAQTIEEICDIHKRFLVQVGHRCLFGEQTQLLLSAVRKLAGLAGEFEGALLFLDHESLIPNKAFGHIEKQLQESVKLMYRCATSTTPKLPHWVAVAGDLEPLLVSSPSQRYSHCLFP
eukprot:m.256571 g.256571  ORF g.256571 m.256571 type:complete len:211 (-) comp15522_c1_seq5:1381-2013(-)